MPAWPRMMALPAAWTWVDKTETSLTGMHVGWQKGPGDGAAGVRCIFFCPGHIQNFSPCRLRKAPQRTQQSRTSFAASGRLAPGLGAIWNAACASCARCTRGKGKAAGLLRDMHAAGTSCTRPAPEGQG